MYFFIINNVDSDSIHYSGTFTDHLPDVSVHQNRIVILNNNNLKLIDIGSKDVIFNTMLIPDLIHVDSVLNRVWVVQHSACVFYTMNVHNSGKFGRIPCKDVSSKAIVANANTLIKVLINKIILWNMHQIV
jgi:hypothetical protein